MFDAVILSLGALCLEDKSGWGILMMWIETYIYMYRAPLRTHLFNLRKRVQIISNLKIASNSSLSCRPLCSYYIDSNYVYALKDKPVPAFGSLVLMTFPAHQEEA